MAIFKRLQEFPFVSPLYLLTLLLSIILKLSTLPNIRRLLYVVVISFVILKTKKRRLPEGGFQGIMVFHYISNFNYKTGPLLHNNLNILKAICRFNPFLRFVQRGKQALHKSLLNHFPPGTQHFFQMTNYYKAISVLSRSIITIITGSTLVYFL